MAPVRFLLCLCLIRYAFSLNALCDSGLRWIQSSAANPYSFDHSSCLATIGSGSSNYPYAVIEVADIFSKSSNYPINFTIIADPIGGSALFGITFYTDNDQEWQSHTTSANTILTLRWQSISSNYQYQRYRYCVPTSACSSSGSHNGPYKYDITHIGIYVQGSTITGSETVQFSHVSLTGLTPAPTPAPTNIPTKHPTDRPTTKDPTKDPSLSPTNDPTNIPTIGPSEYPTQYSSHLPSISPSNYPSSSSSYFPSVSPSYDPSQFPTKAPLIFSTTNIPTIRASSPPSTSRESLKCIDINHVIVEIGFDYNISMNSTLDEDRINAQLGVIVDDLIKAKNESIMDCYISKYVKTIQADLVTQNAKIDISMCTTCDPEDIETNFIDDIMDTDTTLIAILPDTIIIEVDIINDNGEGVTMSTTQDIIMDRPNDKTPETEHDTLGIILGVMGSIICLCILWIILRTLRSKKSGASNAHNELPKSMEHLRVNSTSVRDDGNENINTIPMKSGEEIELEEGTGTGTRSNHSKATPSSPNLDNDEIIIGDDENKMDMVTPQNMGMFKSDDIIIGEDEDDSPTNDTGSSGQITDDPNIMIPQNESENTDNGDDEKYVMNNNNDNNEELVQIKTWLGNKVRFPQYFDNFVKNGYDRMDLIMEITDKADLDEIGIDLPGHKTKLMAEIKKLKRNYLPHAANFNLTFEGD